MSSVLINETLKPDWVKQLRDAWISEIENNMDEEKREFFQSTFGEDEDDFGEDEDEAFETPSESEDYYGLGEQKNSHEQLLVTNSSNPQFNDYDFYDYSGYESDAAIGRCFVVDEEKAKEVEDYFINNKQTFIVEEKSSGVEGSRFIPFEKRPNPNPTPTTPQQQIEKKKKLKKKRRQLEKERWELSHRNNFEFEDFFSTENSKISSIPVTINNPNDTPSSSAQTIPAMVGGLSPPPSTNNTNNTSPTIPIKIAPKPTKKLNKLGSVSTISDLEDNPFCSFSNLNHVEIGESSAVAGVLPLTTEFEKNTPKNLLKLRIYYSNIMSMIHNHQGSVESIKSKKREFMNWVANLNDNNSGFNGCFTVNEFLSFDYQIPFLQNSRKLEKIEREKEKSNTNNPNNPVSNPISIGPNHNPIERTNSNNNISHSTDSNNSNNSNNSNSPNENQHNNNTTNGNEDEEQTSEDDDTNSFNLAFKLQQQMLNRRQSIAIGGTNSNGAGLNSNTSISAKGSNKSNQNDITNAISFFMDFFKDSKLLTSQQKKFLPTYQSQNQNSNSETNSNNAIPNDGDDDDNNNNNTIENNSNNNENSNEIGEELMNIFLSSSKRNRFLKYHHLFNRPNESGFSIIENSIKMIIILKYFLLKYCLVFEKRCNIILKTYVLTLKPFLNLNDPTTNLAQKIELDENSYASLIVPVGRLLSFDPFITKYLKMVATLTFSIKQIKDHSFSFFFGPPAIQIVFSKHDYFFKKKHYLKFKRNQKIVNKLHRMKDNGHRRTLSNSILNSNSNPDSRLKMGGTVSPTEERGSQFTFSSDEYNNNATDGETDMETPPTLNNDTLSDGLLSSSLNTSHINENNNENNNNNITLMTIPTKSNSNSTQNLHGSVNNHSNNNHVTTEEVMRLMNPFHTAKNSQTLLLNILRGFVIRFKPIQNNFQTNNNNNSNNPNQTPNPQNPNSLNNFLASNNFNFLNVVVSNHQFHFNNFIDHYLKYEFNSNPNPSNVDCETPSNLNLNVGSSGSSFSNSFLSTSMKEGNSPSPSPSPTPISFLESFEQYFRNEKQKLRTFDSQKLCELESLFFKNLFKKFPAVQLQCQNKKTNGGTMEAGVARDIISFKDFYNREYGGPLLQHALRTLMDHYIFNKITTKLIFSIYSDKFAESNLKFYENCLKLKSLNPIQFSVSIKYLPILNNQFKLVGVPHHLSNTLSGGPHLLSSFEYRQFNIKGGGPAQGALPYSNAIATLAHVPYCTTPREMGWCIHATCRQIEKYGRYYSAKFRFLGRGACVFAADDLIPTLMFVLIHANIPNLFAILEFIRVFSTTSTFSSSNSDFGNYNFMSSELFYSLTCLEACGEYIKAITPEEIEKFRQTDVDSEEKKYWTDFITKEKKRRKLEDEEMGLTHQEEDGDGGVMSILGEEYAIKLRMISHDDNNNQYFLLERIQEKEIEKEKEKEKMNLIKVGLIEDQEKRIKIKFLNFDVESKNRFGNDEHNTKKEWVKVRFDILKKGGIGVQLRSCDNRIGLVFKFEEERIILKIDEI